jgi:hypothetical protein
MQTPDQPSIGPYAGLSIIIIVMVVGAIYLIQTAKQVIQEKEVTAREIRQSVDAQTESLKSLGTSDEIESIADDAALTDVSNLLPELPTIEKNI